MTPRDLLAVAVLVSTNFDERMAEQAAEAGWMTGCTAERADWNRWRDEDLQRVGAKRALWLEAAPCGWWAGTPKPGHEELARHRIDLEDWDSCRFPVERDGMCEPHAVAAAEIAAVLE